jgi:starch synthase
MVSRLVDQKGFDLIAQSTDDLLQMDAAYVLLGSGERRYEEQWKSLAVAHPDRIAVRVGFDEALAHQIEAGADIFLMPSRFEPCGLNQMYSLRYGTVPVVRAVGGLFDTVQNVDLSTGAGTGFAFDAYTPAALVETLRQAIRTYTDRGVWRRIQTAGMALDLSWDNSARRYVEVYERATI